jgi:hypothetical protein
MTFAEQLNSVLRFSIYYAIIMLILKKTFDSFIFPVIVAAITYIAFDHRERRSEGFEKNVRKGSNGELCTSPTENNPFMNVLADEYNEDKPPACNALDKEIREEIDSNFKKGSFVNQDDIYDRNSGSRQFYTNPVTTTINDQSAFADWLYGSVNYCGKQVRMPKNHT